MRKFCLAEEWSGGVNLGKRFQRLSGRRLGILPGIRERQLRAGPLPPTSGQLPHHRTMTPHTALRNIYGEDLDKVIDRARKYRAANPRYRSLVSSDTLFRLLSRDGFRNPMPIMPRLDPELLDKKIRIKYSDDKYDWSFRYSNPKDPYAVIPRGASPRERMVTAEEVASHGTQPFSTRRLHHGKVPLDVGSKVIDAYKNRPLSGTPLGREAAPGSSRHPDAALAVGSALGHAAKSVEMAPKIAQIKQFYHMKTGKSVATPKEALAAWKWVHEYTKEHPEEAPRGAHGLFYVNPDWLDKETLNEILTLLPALVRAPEEGGTKTATASTRGKMKFRLTKTAKKTPLKWKPFFVKGPQEQLDQIEKLMGWIDYVCSVGHSGSCTISVDGDGSANVSVKPIPARSFEGDGKYNPKAWRKPELNIHIG